jgi:thiamine-monophosphate kinase
VNLSDLAAKGARSLGYLLSLAARRRGRALARRLCRGPRDDQRHFGASTCSAGDTISGRIRAGHFVTALGAVRSGCMVHRSAAVRVSGLYVSGTIERRGRPGALLRKLAVGHMESRRSAAQVVCRFRVPSSRSRSRR